MHIAWGILVPQPGIKFMLLVVETQDPKHWTAREFPKISILKMKKLSLIVVR